MTLRHRIFISYKRERRHMYQSAGQILYRVECKYFPDKYSLSWCQLSPWSRFCWEVRCVGLWLLN